MGLGYRLRISRLRHRGVQIGENFNLGAQVTFSLGENAKLIIGDNVIIGSHGWITVGDNAVLEIGNNTFIFHHASISISTHTRIGDFCSFAPYITIIDSNHRYEDMNKPIRFQGGTYSPIMIDDETWIGTGAVILEGVTLGKHCVIGANAVVTNDIPPFSVAVGMPARIIRKLDDDEL